MNDGDTRGIDIDKVAEGLLHRDKDGIPLSRRCPNPSCTYEGVIERRARGNTVVLLLLLLCGILPGVIYIMAHHGYDYYCPQCGWRK